MNQKCYTLRTATIPGLALMLAVCGIALGANGAARPRMMSTVSGQSGRHGSRQGGGNRSQGMVVLRFVDLENVPVPEVKCRLLLPGRHPSRAHVVRLRDGEVSTVEPGRWTVKVVPTGDHPYTGEGEIDVTAGKLASVLIQVRKLKVARQRVHVVSKNGGSLKQVYVASTPSEHPTLSGMAVTDVAGKASLLVPVGEATILRCTVLPHLPYATHEKEILVEDASREAMRIVLKDKKVSATCSTHFHEDGIRSGMTLTNGRPYVIFSEVDKPSNRLKAYIYDGMFRFYDLVPGKYEITGMRYIFNIRTAAGDRMHYSELAPTRTATFEIADGKETLRLGSIPFRRWPSGLGDIHGSTTGLGERHEGVKVMAFRLDARGKRSEAKAEATTDARGRFSLERLPSGLYDLDASVNGKTIGRMREVAVWPVRTPLVTIHCRR